jgi:putative mRNA 3-end processing factor
MKEITFSFLGGAGEVGKSCYVLEYEGQKLMLDCGVKLTEPPSYPKIPGSTDTLILSHAHSGMVPLVYKRNQTPLYGTDITFELSRILQHDSLKVESIRGFPSRYADSDVDKAVKGEVYLEYGKTKRINDKMDLTFYDAGHIPGSAGTLLTVGETKVLYTGDTNNKETLLARAGNYPKADVMMIESTYGNRDHPDRGETTDEFIGAIESTLDGGGIVLLPAFGVGRSQELLMMLDGMKYPVYLDGMAKTVTRLLLEYPEYLRDPDALQKAANNATWIEDPRDRRSILGEPCIIITTAGMITGGPVIDYIKKLHKAVKSSILLTGYQVEGTNGRLLLDEGYIVDEMTGKKYGVNMNVQHFDFSAHADQSGLIDIASKVDPEKIILVHGDPESCRALSEKLGEKYEVSAPEIGEKIRVPID